MRARWAGLAAATALVVLGASNAAGAAPARYRVGNAATGYAEELVAPTSSPPGVNVAGCRPSAAHPYPVILLPGTLYDLAESYQALGPMLADSGYCVFGLNYGAAAFTSATDGRVWAIGPIAQSAQELAGFVQEVLGQTHASQVDIVGWSQGGMMPRWYIRFDGGAPLVHELVGLAPSNHGTTLDGLFKLITADVGPVSGSTALSWCPACLQQESGSSFLDTLNAGGDTVPGVRYVVIETEYDEIVTPYQSAFLSGPDVQNITLQHQCPADHVDHLGIPYDSVAIQDVIEALGPDSTSFEPRCALELPVVGG